MPFPDAFSDAMLGRGGKLRIPESESGVLDAIIPKLKRVAGERGVNEWAHRELWDVIHQLTALREQVAAGYHRNPNMMILSNPPMRAVARYGAMHGLKVVGEISGEAHAILYRHKDDRKPYEHEFEHPTSLLAVERAGRKDVLITSPDGSPIWQDF